jgi:hypothetical protein
MRIGRVVQYNRDGTPEAGTPSEVKALGGLYSCYLAKSGTAAVAAAAAAEQGKGKGSALVVGARVEAKYGIDDEEWYAGSVEAVSGDGTYTVSSRLQVQ